MAVIGRLITRRVITLIPLMLAVILFIFIVLALSPSSAAVSALGDSATPAQIATFNHQHGLDQPLVVRYVVFLGQLVAGNLGTTYTLNQSIAQIIGQALPITLQLTGLGVLGAIVLAAVLGTVGALYRGRWPDHVTRVIATAGVAMPSFWLAILLIQGFSTIGGGPFPPGHYSPISQGFGPWLLSMTLPALSLGVPVGCALARVTRTSIVEELDKDYVRTAIGGGVHPVVVVSNNVMRNALVTPVTALGVQIGYLIGGAIIIEAIFSLPGMGTQIMTAVTQNDVGLIRGLVIVIALGFIVVNLIVDILYYVINPRLRGGR